LHCAGVLSWAWHAPSTLFQEHLVAFWLLHGLGASLLTVDIMVQRITKQSYPTRLSLFVAMLPVMGTIGSLFLPGRDALLLWALLLTSGLIYVRYWLSIVLQLARHLRINVFTLGPRAK